MNFIFIYVTCKDKEEAKKIAKDLVDKRLAACGNLFPIESVYRWKDKITEENECVLLLKTKQENFEKVKEEIRKMHSYDVPCITKLKVEPNKEYGEWLLKETDF